VDGVFDEAGAVPFRRVGTGRSLSNCDVIPWVILVAELAERFGDLAAQALVFLG
jgi:hypothetical protein